MYTGIFYRGYLDGFGFPQGVGDMQYPDGAHSDGQWERGNLVSGIWESPRSDEGLSWYSGGWYAGQASGYGYQVYASGATYNGYFVNGYRQGAGVFFFKNKSSSTGIDVTKELSPTLSNNDPKNMNQESIKYIGSWYRDQMHGFGVLTNENSQYTGWFSNGKYEGNGKLLFNDGQYADGFWEKGRMLRGRVRLIAGDGFSQYEGPVNFDKETLQFSFNGKSEVRYPGGGIYVGEIKDFKRNGRGTLHFGTGDFQEGNWRDDMLVDGYVRITAQGVGVFMGQWQDGCQHGDGKFFYLDGRVFSGKWDKGMRSGLGTFVYPSGDIVMMRFKEGKRRGRAKRIYTAIAHIYEKKILAKTCGICMKSGGHKVTVCGNGQHDVCLDCRWMLDKCPFCRQPVSLGPKSNASTC